VHEHGQYEGHHQQGAGPTQARAKALERDG
jgi:hypothetical protein